MKDVTQDFIDGTGIFGKSDKNLSHAERELIEFLKKHGSIKSFTGDTGPFRKAVVMLEEKGIIEKTIGNYRGSSKIFEYKLK